MKEKFRFNFLHIDLIRTDQDKVIMFNYGLFPTGNDLLELTKSQESRLGGLIEQLFKEFQKEQKVAPKICKTCHRKLDDKN